MTQTHTEMLFIHLKLIRVTEIKEELYSVFHLSQYIQKNGTQLQGPKFGLSVFSSPKIELMDDLIKLLH